MGPIIQARRARAKSRRTATADPAPPLTPRTRRAARTCYPFRTVLHLRFPAAALAALLGALLFAACSGGGGDHRTPTPEPPARVPSVEEIGAYIGQGFIGQEIGYEQTLVTAFTDPKTVIGLVQKCADDSGKDHADENYWPVLLGNCFFAGNATMRLYQFTHRDEFVNANRLIEQLHRARFEEARAAGAPIGDDYWQLVASSVYDIRTETAAQATPPAAQ